MTDPELLTGYGDQTLPEPERARYAALAGGSREFPVVDFYVQPEKGYA